MLPSLQKGNADNASFFCKQGSQFGVKVESWFVLNLFPVNLRTSGMMRMEANTGRLIFQNSQVCNQGCWTLLKLTKSIDCIAAIKEGTGLFLPSDGQMQL